MVGVPTVVHQNMAAKRVKKEIHFAQLKSNKEVGDTSGIRLEVANNTFTELKGQLAGPRNTPYVEGNFILEIKIGKGYPVLPPKVRFITKIWHPNVNSATGDVCLEGWVGSMTLEAVLSHFQVLLGHAEPDEPRDVVVARQYREDPEMFRLTARHWTQTYAGASGPSYSDLDGLIEKLVDFGAHEIEARQALSMYSWNLDMAADLLFGTTATVYHKCCDGDIDCLCFDLKHNLSIRKNKAY